MRCSRAAYQRWPLTWRRATISAPIASAVAEISGRIRSFLPDVAGLCEVFSDGERAEIRDALQELYPHFQEGADEAVLESDGGLLVLFYTHAQDIFTDDGVSAL